MILILTLLCLQLLLKNKVMSNMIEERDKFNNTALHLASMKGHQETVKASYEGNSFVFKAFLFISLCDFLVEKNFS